MKLGIGTLKTNLLDGIEIVDSNLIGKQYVIALKPFKVKWFNEEFHHGREIEAMLDIETGGLIPLELLELRGCLINNPERN